MVPPCGSRTTYITRRKLGRREVDVRLWRWRCRQNLLGRERLRVQLQIADVDRRVSGSDGAAGLRTVSGGAECGWAQVRGAAETLRAVEVNARAKLAERERERMRCAIADAGGVFDIKVYWRVRRHRLHAQRAAFNTADELRCAAFAVDGEYAAVSVRAESAGDGAFRFWEIVLRPSYGVRG